MCVWFQFLSLDDIKEHKNIDLKCDEDDNAKVSFRVLIYFTGDKKSGKYQLWICQALILSIRCRS